MRKPYLQSFHCKSDISAYKLANTKNLRFYLVSILNVNAYIAKNLGEHLRFHNLQILPPGMNATQ